MKPEVSAFVDKRAKVREITKLLGLSLPYVKRSESGRGTYLYTFRRPGKLTVRMIRDLATQAMKSGQYPQLIGVWDVPHPVGGADTRVQIELDPRDADKRGKEPKPRELQDALKRAVETNDVRAFVVRICGARPILVQSFNVTDIAKDLESEGKVVHKITEIPMMELILMLLVGDYELYQTKQVAERIDQDEQKKSAGDLKKA